jgi:large subunit ribosomal protein L29
MKAKELRERSDQELVELSQKLKRDLFGIRMKNSTGQLDDTSLMAKARKDLARIAQIQSKRVAAKASVDAGSTT